MSPKLNGLLKLAILCVNTSYFSKLCQNCNFFISQNSKHSFTVKFEDFAFPFVYIQNPVTQRFKIKYCISVSLFSNLGFFLIFFSLKCPILITLSVKLRLTELIFENFSRQRYTKVAIFTWNWAKNNENLFTLV